MKKLFAAIVAAVVVAVGTIVAVLGQHHDAGYPIADTGYAYAADGAVTPVAPGARYDIQQGRSLLLQHGTVTELDPARVLRTDDGLRLLNSAVAVLSPAEVTDVVSKSSVVRADLGSYAVADAGGTPADPIPAGSLLKTAEGRYVVLDSATLVQGDGDAEQTVQALGSDTVVALGADGHVRLHDGETTTEQIGDRLRIVLDTSGYVLDLSDERLIDPATGTDLDLTRVVVDLDDSVTAGLPDRGARTDEPSADPSSIEPDSTQTADAAVAGDAGSGTGTGADASGDGSDAVLDLPDVQDGRVQVPAVHLTASAPRDTIEARATVIDPAGALTSTQLQVLAVDGSVVAAATPAITDGALSWTSDALAVGARYTVRLSGTYTDASGTSRQADLGAVPVTIGALDLASTVAASSATSVTFDLRSAGVPADLDTLTLAYRENTTDAPVAGTVTVPATDLSADGQAAVEVTGLSPLTSYVFSVAAARAGGVDLSTSWTSVVSTRARAVGVQGTEARYDAGTQQIVLSLDGLDDPDGSVREVRYLVFDAAEFAAQGTGAPIAASLVTGGERAGQEATLNVPAAMGQGEYVAVAVLTAHDGVDDQQVVAPVSAVLRVSSKHPPQAFFALDQARADALDVTYSINDTDGTLVLDGSTHPVVRLYRADGTGQPMGSPLGTFDLLTTVDLAGGTPRFDGLLSSTDYVAQMTASYDLGDGRLVDVVIGTSVVLTTTDVNPVEVTFALPADRDEVTPTEAPIAFQLNDQGETLVGATLRVTAVSTAQVVREIDVAGLLPSALAPGWASIPLTGLDPATRYQVELVGTADSGGNAIPVTGDEFTFQTRKRVPTADAVALTTVDVAAGRITAQLQQGGSTVVDPDRAVTAIVYRLLDDDGRVVSTQRITQTGSSAVFDLLAIPGAGRGRTYTVRAEMTWFDNYSAGSLTVDSAAVDVPKAGPTADLTYLSRDGQDLAVRVTVTDPDATLIGAPALVVGGRRLDLAVGTQDLRVEAGPGALDLRVLADYQVLVSDPEVTGEVLVSGALPATHDPGDDLSTEVGWSGGRTLTLTPSSGADLAATVLDSVTEVTVDGSAEPDWTTARQGAEALAAQTASAPQGRITMGAGHDLTSRITARYRANGLANDALTGTGVVLTTADGSASARTRNGRVVLGADQYATAYTVESGTLTASGDIESLVLQNATTGAYLGYGTYLNDTSSTSSAMRLAKQTDGSYLLVVSGRYVSFGTSGSTLVGAPASATRIMLATTGTVIGTRTQQLDLPTLTAPDVQVTDLTVGDTSVSVTITGADPDGTMVRDAQGAADLWVSVALASDPTTVIERVRVPDLSGRFTIGSLVGGSEYLLRVVGTHDLGDGAGEVERQYHETTLTTDKSMPVLTTTPTFTWNRLCTGAGPRAVTASTAYLDPSNVLTGLEYDWYLRTPAFTGVDLTDTTALAAAIQASGQSPVHTEAAGLQTTTTMPILDQDGRLYYAAGETYVITTSMTTLLSDAPRVLVAGGSVQVTGPGMPTSDIAVTDVTRTGATARFTVADPTYYLTCADPIPFTATLQDASTGEEVQSSTFTVSRKVSGPPPLTFTDLSPNTTYTLTISTAAHDLRQNGARMWSTSRTFSTATEYVTSNSVTFTVSGDTGRAAASDVRLGAADTITAARFEVYRVDDYGSADETDVLVTSVPAAVPVAGGTVESGDIDLSASGEGTYFVRLVLTYSAGGEDHDYVRDSVYRDYAPGAAALRADLVLGSLVALDAPGLSDGPVTVTATDAAGNVLAGTATRLIDGRGLVVLDRTAADVTIEVVDRTGRTAVLSGLAPTTLGGAR